MDRLNLKMYDLCWIAKQKHLHSENSRIVKAHGLEGEIQPFELTPEDFKEEAEAKILGVEKPKKTLDLKAEAIEETKKPSKKSKLSLPSIGIDED